MNPKELAELISRYKAGTATPEEIAKLDRMWSDSQEKISLSDHTEEQLKDVQQEMFFAIKSEIKKRERNSPRSIVLSPVFYKAAATILLLMAVSVWWYSSLNGLQEIRTSFGEQRTVTLPDQSKVTLNGNSALRYASSWDEKSPREVWIEGEGFFSVIHTKNHQKFVVHGVNELHVEVLGTKFNMKTRESASEVMLTEGKVKLELCGDDSTRTLFLKPGELATIKNKKLLAQSVNKQRYTSWMENKLFFEHTPLRDVCILLNETYGLTVTLAEPELETRELSGEISASTADEILYAISETLDVKVERKGQSVTILSRTH